LFWEFVGDTILEGENMTEIDCKQEAKNIVKLSGAGADNRMVECYVRWILGIKTRFSWNYKSLCKALNILGFPAPTIDEWKSR
jgi:hypothetical protein